MTKIGQAVLHSIKTYMQPVVGTPMTDMTLVSRITTFLEWLRIIKPSVYFVTCVLFVWNMFYAIKLKKDTHLSR